MKDYVLVGVLYLGFLSLVGFTVWFTGSAWALWALLLSPGFTSIGDKDE